MIYDKELLKNWCRMKTWADYLEENGALGDYVSKEGFDHVQGEYFKEIKKRIDHCKQLLKEHEDAFIHYTLAELYDRCNLDESPVYLYKRPVRYHALRALEIELNFVPAKRLLDKANEWVRYLGGDKDYMPEWTFLF